MGNEEARHLGGPQSLHADSTASRKPIVPSRVWFRLDALLPRNLKASRLTDAEFRAYIVSLCEAKLTRSEGEWPSIEHWQFAVGPVLAQHLDVLTERGFLELGEDGTVYVHDWDEWQPKDPTAAERQRRHRDKVRRQTLHVTRDVTQTRQEQNISDNTDAVTADVVAVPTSCPVCDLALSAPITVVETDGVWQAIHEGCRRAA